MSLTSASGRIVRVLCALLCGSAVFASPADRRTSAYYAHLDLTSTFDYFDNSWLKSEHHHQSPAAAPTWTPLEATIPGGNRSPETDEISAIPAAGTATLDVDISYEYDLRGNRKVKNDASGTANDATYDYDLDDRLTAETRGGPGGVGITYGYAKRGDLTTKTVGTATTTYLTDHMGRITCLLADGESWRYTYAPTGDRFSKEDVTIPGSGDMEVYLSSDGDTLIDYTKTGTGTLVFSGIYASPGVDGRVSRVNDLGETSYYFGDALQSVHQVTDGTGEVKRWQFTDAWGNDLYVGKVNTPMGAGDRYGFQGREKDSESGLQFFRARSYDPMTGRFTSRDPVPYPNLYIFVQNGPTNRVDPSGTYDKKDLEVMSIARLKATFFELAQLRDAAIAKGFKEETQRYRDEITQLAEVLSEKGMRWRGKVGEDEWNLYHDLQVVKGGSMEANHVVDLEVYLFEGYRAWKRHRAAQRVALYSAFMSQFPLLAMNTVALQGFKDIGENLSDYVSQEVDPTASFVKLKAPEPAAAAEEAESAGCGWMPEGTCLHPDPEGMMMGGGGVPGRFPIKPQWKARPVGNAYVSGCEADAAEIQGILGGEIKKITPKQTEFMGKYMGENTPRWESHTVVVKDGRVFDRYTGSEGVPIEDWKSMWEGGAEGYNFGF